MKMILWSAVGLVLLAVLAQMALSGGGIYVKIVNESGAPMQSVRLIGNEDVLAQEETLAVGDTARLYRLGYAATILRLEFKQGYGEEKAVFDDQDPGKNWRYYDLVIGPDQRVRVLERSVKSF